MSLYQKAAALASQRKSDEPASDQRRATARAHYDAKQWVDLWKFKKTCKKSLAALGFNAAEAERINFYKPDWI